MYYFRPNIVRLGFEGKQFVVSTIASEVSRCVVLMSSNISYCIITSDKGGGKCVCPRLSVCLLARFLKNAWIDLDEMLHVDKCRNMDELINF